MKFIKLTDVSGAPYYYIPNNNTNIYLVSYPEVSGTSININGNFINVKEKAGTIIRLLEEE